MTDPTRRPKYGPDDVRLMMAHPSGTHNDTRWISLEAERAATGDMMFMLDLTTDQFADLIASRSTVVTSRLPITTNAPAAAAGEGPSCTRCLVPTTWYADGRRWVHAENPATDPRSALREDHPVTFLPQTGPAWLSVTVTATTNEFLTVPVDGLVQVNEYATDGHVISASFRRLNPDGSHAAPVALPDPEWIYRGRGPVSRTVLSCPDPKAHDAVAANPAADAVPSPEAEVNRTVMDLVRREIPHRPGTLRVQTTADPLTTIVHNTGSNWTDAAAQQMYQVLRKGFPDALEVRLFPLRDMVSIRWEHRARTISADPGLSLHTDRAWQHLADRGLEAHAHLTSYYDEQQVKTQVQPRAGAWNADYADRVATALGFLTGVTISHPADNTIVVNWPN